jgi:hypothetical protein
MLFVQTGNAIWVNPCMAYGPVKYALRKEKMLKAIQGVGYKLQRHGTFLMFIANSGMRAY